MNTMFAILLVMMIGFGILAVVIFRMSEKDKDMAEEYDDLAKFCCLISGLSSLGALMFMFG